MDSLRRLTSSVFDSHARLGRRHSGSGISAFLPSGLGGADPATALDLTFITEQLIVCGFPVARASSKRANEINVDELAEYLETHHANHYLIFNLNALDQSDAPSSACASPAYDSNSSSSTNNTAPSLIEQLWKRTPQLSNSSSSSPAADAHAIAAKVREQMLEFSWERDGMKAHTPPMDLIFRICYSIFAWLSLDAANVAVVNCETGKTRSGVVVACYLLFARLADDPIAAFVAFYRKRWAMRSLTPEALQSKTPPSIQRFLASFYALLELQKPPNDAPLVLKAIIFRALPVELQPCVQIWDDYRLVFCTDSASGGHDDSSAPVLEWNSDDGFFAIAWEHGVELDGGFSILCSFGDEYDTSSSAGDDSDASALDASSRVLFRYADSTWFLTPGVVTLSKRQLDMMKQYEHGFDDDHFSVDLVLHAAASSAPALTTARPSHVRLDYTGNHAVRQGLLEITKHHVVLPDPAMHSNFLRMGFGETPTTFALQRSQNAPNVALDLLHSDMLAACFGRLETQASVAAEAPAVAAATLSTSASPLRRQTTAEIVAMQSQRSRYASTTLSSATSGSGSGGACTCVVCNDDDYMLRPQLVQCSGACSRFYHTTCAGLRKIPFGLTTLSDRTNHSVYVKKFFSAWECDACAPAAVVAPVPVAGGGAVPPGMTLVPTSWAKSYAPGAAPGVPIERAASGGATAPSDLVTTSSDETSDAAKMDKLREFLLASGVSVDDLLRAATTPNVAIAPATVPLDADSGSTGAPSVSTASTVSPARPGPAISNSTAPPETAEPPVNDSASAARVFKTEALSGANGATSLALVSAPVSPVQTSRDVTAPTADAVVAPSEYSSVHIGAPGTSDADAAKNAKAPAPASASLAVSRSDLMAQIAARTAPQANATAMPAPIDRNAALLRDIVAKRGSKSDDTVTPDAADALPPAPASSSSNGESKYAVMLKRGVPFAAVQNCMVKDGEDPSTLSPLPSSAESSASVLQSPPAPPSVRLRDVDEFKSYFEMLRLGCPKDAVKHKLIMDGLDPLIVDFGPDALYDDAMRDKLSHAVPLEARSRLQDDITGVRAPRSQRLETTSSGAASESTGPASEPQAPPLPVEPPSSLDTDAVLLRDHEVYSKYFKMLKMGLPEDAVRHKIKTDGANEQALALGGDATYAQLVAASTAPAPTLGDDPVYAKYFKMLKMGLPDGAVRHKMATDGVDARALDLGPDALVSALVASSTSTGAAPTARKPPPRRKKLHWQAISDDRLQSLHQQTIWEDRGDDDVAFDMDMDELESLFFANADAGSSGSSKKKASQSKALQRKQSVTLIDAKRAMNAAISLARVKLSYCEIAAAVETFDAKSLTLEQLVGISEFLPTAEEAALVAAYTGDVAVLGEVRCRLRV